MIYDSNRRSLEDKISALSSDQRPHNDAGQPPSGEIMRMIQTILMELEKNPDNVDLMVQAGNAHFDIGQFDKAIIYYKNVSALHPGNAEILIDLGVSYFNLSQLDSALVFMQQALQIEDSHKQGLYNIGIVYYNLGRMDQAIQSWNKLIQKHTNSAEAQAAKEFIEQLKKQQTGT